MVLSDDRDSKRVFSHMGRLKQPGQGCYVTVGHILDARQISTVKIKPLDFLLEKKIK